MVLIVSFMIPGKAMGNGSRSGGFDVISARITKKVGLNGSQLDGRTLLSIAGAGETGDQFSNSTAGTFGFSRKATTGILGRPLPRGGKRYAMIIGISDYMNSSSHVLDGGFDLSYCDDDAITMKQVLTGVYGFDETLVLMGPEDIENYAGDAILATRENILQSIESMVRKVRPRDEFVLHYSGHGAYGLLQGEPVVGIVPCDGIPNPDQTGSNIIWDFELDEAFRKLNARRAVFVFDSCNAGGMTELAGRNRIVCMSTAEDGLAAEYGEDYWDSFGIIPGFENMNHGVFTYAFAVLGIQKGWADLRNHDRDWRIFEPDDVTIEEAFDLSRMILVLASLFVPELNQIPEIIDNFCWDLLP